LNLPVIIIAAIALAAAALVYIARRRTRRAALRLRHKAFNAQVRRNSGYRN
jgi:hypothetical protein